MAASIDAKLSSKSTMSAAALETSVPVMPMAIPISACLRAGASLMPSPVIATTCPSDCRASTRRIFCSGATRAKTLTDCTFSISSLSVSFASSAPVMTPSQPWPQSPICLPMAAAVRAWSPVIILTVMPAWWQVRTASIASGRVGSIMPCKPKRVRLSTSAIVI